MLLLLFAYHVSLLIVTRLQKFKMPIGTLGSDTILIMFYFNFIIMTL